MKPRQYTTEEVQEKFLRHIWGLIGYWENDDRTPTSQGKMEGLAHSIFAAIDGSSMALPAFIVAPLPHKDDKAYNIGNKENYFPINPRKENGDAANVKSDIGGNLAYQLFRVREKMQKEALTKDSE
jgi:hypothetical protein